MVTVSVMSLVVMVMVVMVGRDRDSMIFIHLGSVCLPVGPNSETPSLYEMAPVPLLTLPLGACQPASLTLRIPSSSLF